MILEKALVELNSKQNTRDILEILWITFNCNHFDNDYYKDKIEKFTKWEYFISDLDGTFFRWTLQKEAVSLFIKFVKKQDYFDMDLDDYSNFLKDVKFFNDLEKKAYNKEIEYFEYLNAGIFLLLKHKNLVEWDEYLAYIKYSFKKKEKINPFRFSFKKLKEILEGGKNFIFVSWAPDFIFDIYLDLLKKYIWKNIWEQYIKQIFWVWSFLSINTQEYMPLWGKDHKSWFIKRLIDNWIFTNIVWWMWDTASDFWISYMLNENTDFYFVNPEKKVFDKFDEFKKDNINYHFVIERKDLIIEVKKEDIKYI